MVGIGVAFLLCLVGEMESRKDGEGWSDGEYEGWRGLW